jgi:hypothetical protein
MLTRQLKKSDHRDAHGSPKTEAPAESRAGVFLVKGFCSD